MFIKMKVFFKSFDIVMSFDILCLIVFEIGRYDLGC